MCKYERMHTMFGIEVRAIVGKNVCGLKKLGTDVGYMGFKGAKTHADNILKHGQTSVPPALVHLHAASYTRNDLPAETRSDLPRRNVSSTSAVHVPPVRRVDARIHAGVFLSVGLVRRGQEHIGMNGPSVMSTPKLSDSRASGTYDRCRRWRNLYYIATRWAYQARTAYDSRYPTE